jgi:hypothetical protein
MATTTPNYGWPVPTSSDLVKNGATAIEALGDAADATMATMVPKSIVDAKGDLIAATAADTVARLAIGTNNQVLTADSAQATGMKWATPAGGGGKVLQVVQGTLTTAFTTTSTSFVDSGLTVTITPSSATSKVMVFVSLPTVYASRTGSGVSAYAGTCLLRGATTLQVSDIGIFNYYNGSNWTAFNPIASSYLDSPATTSATTYKVQAASYVASSIYLDATSTKIASIVAMEIGA